MDSITCKGMSFVDNHGRERIFYGINLCDKGSYEDGARHYCHEWDDELIDSFAAKGFNCVRLGTTWEAIEPEKGVFDEEYIDSIARTLDKFEKRGIYAYLDMHQDLYAGSPGGSGDGAPYWACLTDGAKFHKTKLVWAEGYFWGRAVHRCFDNFWNDRLPEGEEDGRGIQDYYDEMWAHLAARLGPHKALFGYDLMNEPFPGTPGGRLFARLVVNVALVTITSKSVNKVRLIKNALSPDTRIKVLDEFSGRLLRKITSAGDKIIAEFDTKKYSPFLNKASQAIRGETAKGVIFIEGSYYSNISIPSCARPIEVDGRRESEQAYAPHGYDIPVDTPMYKYASSDRVHTILDAHRETQRRLDMPVMFGEWGGFSEGDEWLPHLSYILNAFDEYHWSSTYWAYFGGLFDSPAMRVLVRPHPVAVTGEILQYHWDDKNRVFTLAYRQSRKYSVPTEVWLPCEPSKVEVPGEYTTEPSGEGVMLGLTTGAGVNNIRVEL